MYVFKANGNGLPLTYQQQHSLLFIINLIVNIVNWKIYGIFLVINFKEYFKVIGLFISHMMF